MPMKCPNCSANVADDASICPECDHIIDASFLEAPAEPAARPPPRQRPPGKGPPPGKRPMRRPPGPGGGPPKKIPTSSQPGVKRVGRMPDAPQRPAGPREQVDWRSQVSQEEWGAHGAGGPPPPAKFQADKGLDAEALMGDWKSFLGELSNADKIGFFGAVGMALACFFPWRETAHQGDSLGVTSLGIITALCAFGACAAIVVRVRNKMKGVNPTLPWAAQLGALGFGVLWAFVFIIISWDSQLTRADIGNEEVWMSKPSFGVFFAIASGTVAVLGTLLSLREKND